MSIAFPAGLNYTPGAKQRLTVTVADPDLSRWAFQLTARLASNQSNGQGGSFTSINSLTTVKTDTSAVQFIQTSSGGTQQGVRGSATYQMDWTAPSTNLGNIIFYIAGMAANGSGKDGDRVYSANYTMSSGTTSAPMLSVNPTSLGFNYVIGGTAPAAQNLSVGSSGTALSFTASEDSAWLAVSPTAGTTPATVNVTANPSGLAAGTYNGQVTITATGVSNSPLTVAATLIVSSSAPTPGIDSKQFKVNIGAIANTKPGEYPQVTFSVTDPTDDNKPYDIKTHPAFTSTASGASRLFVQIGWDTRDYTNTGSGSELALSGAAAAQPIAIDALATSVSNGNGTYTVKSPRSIPSFVTGSGVAVLEGHPAGPDATGAWSVRVPVKSIFKAFLITGDKVVKRRQVVDNKKCGSCHGVLTLHGNNRTEETQVCVVCHNPNATDIPYRRSSDPPEAPIDFKVMVHSIHAAQMRTTPYVVLGRNHSVNDFSTVQFPASLKDCMTCHREGTYLLPMKSQLGTTIKTWSVTTLTNPAVNNDPADDTKITPAAATCSACHDNLAARNHMVKQGASFETLQQWIDSGAVAEKCIKCHGVGKDKDVAKVHAN